MLKKDDVLELNVDRADVVVVVVVVVVPTTEFAGVDVSPKRPLSQPSMPAAAGRAADAKSSSSNKRRMVGQSLYFPCRPPPYIL